MAYIGIDLHSNKFTSNFIEEGCLDYRESYYLDKHDMNNFTKRLSKNDCVAIEASTNTFSFYDLIKDKVKQTIIVNPLDFHIINNTSKKTDKVDAIKLSKMLKYHVVCTGKKHQKIKRAFHHIDAVQKADNKYEKPCSFYFKRELKAL